MVAVRLGPTRPGPRIATRALALAKFKGGVLSTTLATLLAAQAGARGVDTLLIDLDPQGHATMAVGVDAGALDRTMADVLLGRASLADVAVETTWPGVWVAPADLRLEACEGLKDARQLARALSAIDGVWPAVIMDTRPGLGKLTMSALAAADQVLLPVEPGLFARDGARTVLAMVQEAQAHLNPGLHVLGAVITRVSSYSVETMATIAEMRAALAPFGVDVFESVMPNCEWTRRSQTERRPVTSTRPSSPGARAARHIFTEVLDKWPSLIAAAKL